MGVDEELGEAPAEGCPPRTAIRLPVRAFAHCAGSTHHLCRVEGLADQDVSAGQGLASAGCAGCAG